jgi:hypothetical protein
MDPYRQTREGQSHLLTVTLIKEDGHLASYPPVTGLFKFRAAKASDWELYNVNHLDFGTFLGKGPELITNIQGDFGSERAFMARMVWKVNAMHLITVMIGPGQLTAYMSEEDASVTFDQKERDI